MKEDYTELFERVPELRYAEECGNHLDAKRYSEAEALALEGLRVAEARGNPRWAQRFRNLLDLAQSRDVSRPAKVRCTICGRSSTEVEQFISGAEVFLCSICVASCIRATRGLPVPGMTVGKAAGCCSLCYRTAGDSGAVTAGSVTICGECLEFCHSSAGEARPSS